MGQYYITHYLGKPSIQEWSETISPSWKLDHSNTCNNCLGDDPWDLWESLEQGRFALRDTD